MSSTFSPSDTRPTDNQSEMEANTTPGSCRRGGEHTHRELILSQLLVKFRIDIRTVIGEDANGRRDTVDYLLGNLMRTLAEAVNYA